MFARQQSGERHCALPERRVRQVDDEDPAARLQSSAESKLTRVRRWRLRREQETRRSHTKSKGCARSSNEERTKLSKKCVCGRR